MKSKRNVILYLYLFDDLQTRRDFPRHFPRYFQVIDILMLIIVN